MLNRFSLIFCLGNAIIAMVGDNLYAGLGWGVAFFCALMNLVDDNYQHKS